MKELIKIQTELKAPKSQRNKFGNYNYRSTEDILESLKPILNKHNCWINISDRLVLIGDRYYVEATAQIKNAAGETEFSQAYARESENKKGMDSSQITGAASSYARKYALNGLFAIDDTKDADATNNHDTTYSKKDFIALWNKKGKPKLEFDKWENLTDKQKEQEIKKLKGMK